MRNSNLLHPAPIPASLLCWVASERTFAAEASTLDAQGIRPGRVYADACDVGFTLVSPSGREVVFVQTDSVRRDGELLFEVYSPAPEDPVARERGCQDVRIHVYND